jgi:hypothetical protein
METTNNIQFYADKKNEYSNRLFSFAVYTQKEAFKILLRFHCNANTFRAIFWKTKLCEQGFTTWDSTELLHFYNFFTSYKKKGYVPLAEATKDFEEYLTTE